MLLTLDEGLCFEAEGVLEKIDILYDENIH